MPTCRISATRAIVFRTHMIPRRITDSCKILTMCHLVSSAGLAAASSCSRMDPVDRRSGPSSRAISLTTATSAAKMAANPTIGSGWPPCAGSSPTIAKRSNKLVRTRLCGPTVSSSPPPPKQAHAILRPRACALASAARNVVNRRTASPAPICRTGNGAMRPTIKRVPARTSAEEIARARKRAADSGTIP